MNAEERVAVLEGLLARVRRKAAEPRMIPTAAAAIRLRDRKPKLTNLGAFQPCNTAAPAAPTATNPTTWYTSS